MCGYKRTRGNEFKTCRLLGFPREPPCFEPLLFVNGRSVNLFLKLRKLDLPETNSGRKSQPHKSLLEELIADARGASALEIDYLFFGTFARPNLETTNQAEKFGFRVDKLSGEYFGRFLDQFVCVIVTTFDCAVLDLIPVKIVVLQLVNQGEKLGLAR